jgi:GNAT superfamily N-acetyltransferase
MGIWRTTGNNSQIFGISAFDVGLGEAFIQARPGFEYLYPELLNWAEQEIAEPQDDKHHLAVWITDKETVKQQLLTEKGYTKTWVEPVKVFFYDKTPFSTRQLPPGFALNNFDNIDPEKLAKFFWRAFHNPGDPPESFVKESWLKTMSTPHFNPRLARLVTAPNGDYACARGMWVNPENQYAYLEPLATNPDYRKLGLAEVALTDAMRDTQKLGAKWCNGGSGEFYSQIGFESIMNREKWERTF